MEWLSSAAGAVATAVAGASKTVRERPGTAIAVTNVLTAAFFVYIISEGKPVKYIKKKLFQAAMAAVPKSLVDKELAKVKRDIERDIIGHSLDGETLFQELPSKGVFYSFSVFVFSETSTWPPVVTKIVRLRWPTVSAAAV